MGESEEQTHLDVEGFSLIDFSSENDCLISSPQIHPSSERGNDHKSVKFTEASDIEAMVGSSEDMEQGQNLPNSAGPEKKSKGGKYNLRKSLAWDTAFFTNAGVLDAEELSTMIGGEKCSLPGIQEDINKSCDSLTTLDSEALTLESLEADLFEDLRASIQRTSKASSPIEKEFGVKESQNLLLNKVKVASQDKMKVKAAAKKPSSSTQESLRTLNQVSVHRQASQPVSRIRDIPKATRGTKQIIPVAVTSTKRISPGSKNVEMEQDAKNATGRGTTMLKTRALGGPKNALRRPIPPPKTSIPSISSSRKELTSSCSSSESVATAFSGKNHKSSLELVSGGNHSSRSTAYSSSSTVRTPRAASRSNHKTESSELSNYLKSATVNLSANISPASSISEWSSASSSSTLTVDQRLAARASIGARASNTHSKDKDVQHVLDSHHQSASNCSAVNSSLPVCSSNERTKATSITGNGPCNTIPAKPSGLRMPSPKIGFFDGVRSSSHTPKGSVLSRPTVPNGLPKSRMGTVGLKESPDQGKLLKVKPADTLTSLNNGKSGKQTSVGTKFKTLPEESPTGGRKISSASRNTRSISVVSPKVEKKSSPKPSGGSGSNAEQVGYEGSGLDLDSSNSSLVEKNETGRPGLQKHVGCVQNTGFSELRSGEVSLLNGVNEEMNDSSSKCEVKSSERTIRDERCKLYDSKSELQSYSDSNGKEFPIEGEVARLAKRFGAVDVNKGAQNESGDAPKVCEVSMDKAISPVTSKDVATTRIPLYPKDSACNAFETLDVSIPENLLQDSS